MLETLLGNLPGLVYRCRNDECWTAEFFSDGTVAITGYPAADFNEHRRHYADLIHSDDRVRVWDEVQAALAARARFTLTYRIVTAGGSSRWVREQGCGVYAPDGALQALEGFVTDITEQRAAESALRESEQRYRSLFAANPNPMWVYDLETLRFLAVNDAATTHYGYSQAEFLRMTIADIRPAEDVPRLVKNVSAVTSGLDEAGCWRHRRKDDSIIEVEITSHTLDFDGRRAELVLAVDVTERRRTEAAMRLQSSALNAAANAIMITDRDGSIEWVNPAWTSLTGYTLAEAVGQNPRILKSGAQDAAFYDRFWRTVLAGQCVQGELINRRKDGALYHEHETITPVTDEAGRITHFIAIKQDITERKRSEADRERESNLLISTLRSLPGVFYLFDADGHLLRWNDNFARATGYSAAELAGRPPSDFLAPEDHATVRARIEKVFTEGAADVEGHLLSRDGTRTPYYFTGVRVELEGRPHLVGVGVDITERRLAEERIRRLNRTYAVLSDINQLIVRSRGPAEIIDGACRIAVEKGGFLFACISLRNESSEELHLAAHAGADPETQLLAERLFTAPGPSGTFTAQAFSSGIPALCNDIASAPEAAAWRDVVLEHGSRAMASFPFSAAGRRAGTFDLYAAHAGFFDTAEVQLLDELAGDIGFGLEIHERDRQRGAAEAALRESESRFRTVLESVALIGLMLDREGRIQLCSDHLLALTGWTREEVVGGDWFEIFLPSEEREHIRRDIFLTTITSGVFPQHLENEIITRQGERRLIAWSNSLVRDPEGKIVGVASLGEDITERQHAEQQIRKLAAFPRLNPNPVLEFSAEGKPTYANPAAHAMARDIGVDDITRLPPSETPALVRACLATGQPRLRVLTRHGAHTISWSFHPIATEGVVHCYAGDITSRLTLEEQLRQSQKMDAIGQLAGGVAHDFNNLLTVIHGNVSMARMPDTSEVERAEALGEIAGAAERAAALTRQLLTFSRRQVMQPRSVDLNETVTAIARMLQRVLGEQVHLQLHLHPRPMTTLADPGMLDQVLMNLAVNARDAMPGGGQLTLATDVSNLNEKDIALFPEARPGPHVCLRVSDTGCGIPPENLPHIFEPFFTTKDPGKGTGLGLATVFGIVKQHSGTLRVSSAPGHGTTFEILLPADNTAITGPMPAGKTAAPCGSGETILVVEDETAVRRLAVRVLETHGYRVFEASNGREALQVFAETSPRPDLLITDMIMPAGLTGRELAERLRAETPNLRALYMSGYAGDSIRHGLNLEEGVNFLAKPFQPDTLLHCVRARLNSPA